MISVKNLTKNFGLTRAVDGISFDIPQGQVVGFLGPNGAGKTTSMRLLTGFLTPDDGEARLAGQDIYQDSIEIRKRLGYLPENNPLPEDLETTDYLNYVARLRGLTDPGRRFQSVKKALETCSLGEAVGKKLSELSKGFRQRVGLAQAILHDPDILILDEPTSGLDPNQVQDVRRLIEALKQEKTLLISTHILSEVQTTCDRVLIIHQGKLVADGTPSGLNDGKNKKMTFDVSFKGPVAEIRSALEKAPGVSKALEKGSDGDGNPEFSVESVEGNDPREEIFKMAATRNWPIMFLRARGANLEQVFSDLTRGAGEKA